MILIAEIRMKVYKLLGKIVFLLLFLYGLYILWTIFSFGGGCKKMSPETHILPYGFTGDVYIYFNQKQGNSIEYDKNIRIYRIPKSGVLHTKFKHNTGSTDSEKYLKFYYELNDSLIMLNKVVSGNIHLNLDSNAIVVFEYGMGTGWDAFGHGELVATTYLVDSFKNIMKREYTLSKERFDNWDK